MAEITGFRVKYQEAGGSILANAFNKNLGSGQHCGRDECPPCRKPEGRENCKARNIVYESKCLVCNPASSHGEDDHADQPSGRTQKPREGIYIGESSRSLHERALEHVRDAQSFSAKSHIIKHWMLSHPALPSPPEMDFNISARFKDCLSRQIGEALRINFSKDILLNSKSEYRNNSLNRITIQEDAWERRERSRLEDEQDELDKRKVEEFRRMKCASASHAQPDVSPAVQDMPQPDKNRTTLEGGSSVTKLTGTLCNTLLRSSLEGESCVTTQTCTLCNTVSQPNREGEHCVYAQTGSQSNIICEHCTG
jgi:hypothetical protein